MIRMSLFPEFARPVVRTPNADVRRRDGLKATLAIRRIGIALSIRLEMFLHLPFPRPHSANARRCLGSALNIYLNVGPWTPVKTYRGRGAPLARTSERNRDFSPIDGADKGYAASEAKAPSTIVPVDSTSSSLWGTSKIAEPQSRQTRTSGKTQTIGLFSPASPGK